MISPPFPGAERQDRLLTLLLLAALAAPIAAGAVGHRVATPFALTRWELALLLAAVAAAHLSMALTRRNWPRVALELAAVVVVALPLAQLVRTRENLFYSTRTLMEGLTVLLLVHVVARASRWLAETARALRGERRPAFLTVADRIAGASLLATLAAFALAFPGYREAAGAFLVAATGLEAIMVLLRLDDAVRGVRALAAAITARR